MNFVADVDLAISLSHKSRREIRKNETEQTNSTFTDFVRFNKNVSPMKKHMKLARELNG
jgi:hypothetical protein